MGPAQDQDPPRRGRRRVFAAESERRLLDEAGFMYRTEKRVPKNIDQAVAFFKQSGADGVPLGCAYLGVMYKYGKGVRKDIKQAAALCMEPATKAFRSAVRWRGSMSCSMIA